MRPILDTIDLIGLLPCFFEPEAEDLATRRNPDEVDADLDFMSPVLLACDEDFL